MSRTRNWLRCIRKQIDILFAQAGNKPINWVKAMEVEIKLEKSRLEDEKDIERIKRIGGGIYPGDDVIIEDD